MFVTCFSAKETLTSELTSAERSLSKNAYPEDSSIVFIPPDSAIIAAISKLGKVTCHSPTLNLTITRPPRGMASNYSSQMMVQNFTHSGDAAEGAQKSFNEQSLALPRQLLEKQVLFVGRSCNI